MKITNCIVSAAMIVAFGIQGGCSEEAPTVGIHPDGRGRGGRGGKGYPGKGEERERHLEQDDFGSMSLDGSFSVAGIEFEIMAGSKSSKSSESPTVSSEPSASSEPTGSKSAKRSKSSKTSPVSSEPSSEPSPEPDAIRG